MSISPREPTKLTGANIRAEMARRKVPQTAIAERLGLSQTSVSARLAGRVAFDINEIHAIAALLGVPITLLIPEVTDSVAS